MVHRPYDVESQYGANTHKKSKQPNTPAQAAKTKGAAKQSHTKSSAFRYAPLLRALKMLSDNTRQVGKTRAGGKDKSTRWSKGAVMMVAVALEYRLQRIMKQAQTLLSFSKGKTLTAITINHVAELNGEAQDNFRTTQQQQADGDAVVVALKSSSGNGPKKGRLSKAAKADVRHAETADMNGKLQNEFDVNKSSDPLFAAVASVVTPAAISRLAHIAGITRIRHLEVQVTLVRASYAFLKNIARNVCDILSLRGDAVTVSTETAQSVIGHCGLPLGFSGVSKIERRRKAAKAQKGEEEEEEESSGSSDDEDKIIDDTVVDME